MHTDQTGSTAREGAAPAAQSPGARKAELHLWYATLTVTLASGVMSTIGVYEVLAANRAYGFYLSLLVGVVITGGLPPGVYYFAVMFLGVTLFFVREPLPTAAETQLEGSKA